MKIRNEVMAKVKQTYILEEKMRMVLEKLGYPDEVAKGYATHYSTNGRISLKRMH